MSASGEEVAGPYGSCEPQHERQHVPLQTRRAKIYISARTCCKKLRRPALETCNNCGIATLCDFVGSRFPRCGTPTNLNSRNQICYPCRGRRLDRNGQDRHGRSGGLGSPVAANPTIFAIPTRHRPNHPARANSPVPTNPTDRPSQPPQQSQPPHPSEGPRYRVTTSELAQHRPSVSRHGPIMESTQGLRTKETSQNKHLHEGPYSHSSQGVNKGKKAMTQDACENFPKLPNTGPTFRTSTRWR